MGRKRSGLSQHRKGYYCRGCFHGDVQSIPPNPPTPPPPPPEESGSLNFSSGSYLVPTSTPSNLIMSGDFTVEFWFKWTATTTIFPQILAHTGLNFEILIDSIFYLSNKVSINIGGAIIFGTTTVTDSNWHHVAVCRVGSTVTLYVDGDNNGTVTFSGTAHCESFSLGVAVYAPEITYYNGYLSNLRIVSGTALYTSDFTPPTSPLSLIDDTNLLLKTEFNSDYLLDSSPNDITYTMTGTVTSSDLNPFSP
jgi:hypothetical protein